jgi:hypothetical protein
MEYGRAGEAKRIDRGQVLELEGLVNDEKLVRLGYVSLINKRATIVTCGKCGAQFVTDEALATHGRDRHAPPRQLTPQEEDQRVEARHKLEDELSPLNLDKTAAARGYVRT